LLTRPFQLHLYIILIDLIRPETLWFRLRFSHLDSVQECNPNNLSNRIHFFSKAGLKDKTDINFLSYGFIQFLILFLIMKLESYWFDIFKPLLPLNLCRGFFQHKLSIIWIFLILNHFCVVETRTIALKYLSLCFFWIFVEVFLQRSHIFSSEAQV